MLWRERKRVATSQQPESGQQVGEFEAFPAAFLPSVVEGLVWTAFRSTGMRLFFERGRSGVFAQVVADPGRDHWLIIRLHLSADWETAARLVDRIAAEAGAQGIVRLHTLVPEDPAVLEWWQSAGFHPFRRVLLLSGRVDSQAELPLSVVQEQGSVDAWALQRLYERITPRPVQYAEARTRSSWQVGHRAGWRTRGFLLVIDGEAHAYCRIRTRRGHHVVDVLASLDVNEDAVELTRVALAQTGRVGDHVLILVPEDEAALVTSFERMNFRIVGARLWVARYTVRRIRLPSLAVETARLAVLPEVHQAYYRRDGVKIGVTEGKGLHY